MMHIPRSAVSVGVVALLCACEQDKTARSAPAPQASDTSAAIAAPARDTQPATAPVSAADSMASADSISAAKMPASLPAGALPEGTYADVPGWYVPYTGRAQDSGEPQPLAEGANLRIFTYPPTNVWAMVRNAPAALLFDGGQVDVQIVFADAGQIVRRGGHFVSRLDVAISSDTAAVSHSRSRYWLLPHRIAGAAVLRPTEKILGDTAIVWSTGDGVGFVFRRTSRTAAQLLARTASGTLVPIHVIEIDRATDSSMGVDSDSALKLKGDWRSPRIGEAFRLGPAGPWVFLLFESGYECYNDFLVRVDSTSARTVNQMDHYAECQSDQ